MDSQNQGKDAKSQDATYEQKAKAKETKYKLNPIRFSLTKFTIYETKSVSRNLQRNVFIVGKLIFIL